MHPLALKTLKFKFLRDKVRLLPVRKPSGYGNEFVARVPRDRVLVPLNIHHVDGANEVKSVKAQSPPLGVVFCPSSVSWDKLPTRTTQPTSRIGTLTSTFNGLKEDTCTKDSLAADQR
ncbi:hypothetical protein TNCV_2793851 [Trichonephila clavipes]|nr:hypothetical protein TNCV_2793851 [Trichonephila clavipes]